MLSSERLRPLPVRYATWLAPLLVGVFAFIFAVEKIYNYDIWWHLRFGAELVATGAYPYLDTFSFSTYGEPWLNSSWLFGVFSYLLQLVIGLNGLILLKALIIGLSFAGACLFLIRQGVHPLLAALFIGTAVPLARFRFLLRPVLFTFPGAIFFYAVFSNLVALSWRRMLLLAAVTVIWINLHGSGLLALILGGCFAVETTVYHRFPQLAPTGPGGVSPKKAWQLFGLLAVSVLVTPNGLQLFKMVFLRGYDDLITQTFSVVNEQAPLQWGQYPGYWLLMIATALSFVMLRKQGRVYAFLVFLVTSWLALGSVRFVGLAIFMQAIILCLNLHQLTQPLWLRLNQQRWLAEGGLVLLAAVGALIFVGTFTEGKTYSWGLGVQESRFPVAATRYLQDLGYEGNIYNTWEYGGYLLWNLPKAKVFVDGRALDAQLRIKTEHDAMTASQLNAYLQKQAVDVAVIMKKERQVVDDFNAFPDFYLARADDQTALYVRKGLDPQEKAGYRYIRLDGFDVSYLVPLAKSAAAPEVEQELRRAVVEAPKVFTPNFQLAVFLELLDRDEALDYYYRAASANPALAFSHFPLFKQAAQFALRKKRYQVVVDLQVLADKTGKVNDGETDFLVGTAYYALQRYPEAEDHYQKAYKALGATPNLVANMGYLYLDARQGKDAEAMFQQLIALAPDKETGYYGLAMAREQMSDPKAIDSWRDFLQKFPKSPYAQRARQAIERGGAP